MKPTHSTFDLSRILRAARYSWQGLTAAWRDEAAFRQETILAAVAVPLTFWLDVSRAEQALLIGVVLLILIVELLNSALEATLDRISEEHHPLTQKGKDIGSAAVLLACLNAALVWGVILASPSPHIILLKQVWTAL